MNITYTTQRGEKISETLTHAEAVDRLAFLDHAEAEAVQYAPTDSGTTRIEYNREAKAIRASLMDTRPNTGLTT